MSTAAEYLFVDLPIDRQRQALSMYRDAGPADGCVYELWDANGIWRRRLTVNHRDQLDLLAPRDFSHGFAIMCDCGRPAHIPHCCGCGN